MSSRLNMARKEGVPRRRRQLVIKERNISADEFMAASIGDVEWLDQSLQESGSTSNFEKNGLAPLHLAALHGRLNCLQLLIEKYQVDVNMPSATGWTALHLCINKEVGPRALKCTNYLLEKGAEVDSINDDNVTPAHQAASEGLLECLRVLVEKGADLSVTDVRGHLPLDLAKIWAHKACGKLIRNEMWKREKQEKASELKQLNIVKQYYGDLQKDAIHQLRNEQEFYGGVAFGNWLVDKGLPEKLKNMTTSQRERYPETSTEGLSKRLRISGGLDDCAQRMEKTTLKQQKRQVIQAKQERAAPVEKPNSKQPPKSKPEKQVAPAKPAKVTEKQEKVKRVVKVERPIPEKQTDTYSHREEWDGSKLYTPYSEMTAPSEKPTRKSRWNFSTNINSDPITNIKCKDTVALSIQPDDMDMVLPKSANLSVKLETAARPKIRVTLPGGRIKSADIRMPQLPPNLINEVLSGVPSDRIRIPQEFKAVHVYDIQKKKQAVSVRKNEVGMHLSFSGDPRILRKSISSNGASATITPSFGTNTYPTLPEIRENRYSRTLDTLNRMHPPTAFLA